MQQAVAEKIREEAVRAGELVQAGAIITAMAKGAVKKVKPRYVVSLAFNGDGPECRAWVIPGILEKVAKTFPPENKLNLSVLADGRVAVSWATGWVVTPSKSRVPGDPEEELLPPSDRSVSLFSVPFSKLAALVKEKGTTGEKAERLAKEIGLQLPHGKRMTKKEREAKKQAKEKAEIERLKMNLEYAQNMIRKWEPVTSIDVSPAQRADELRRKFAQVLYDAYLYLGESREGVNPQKLEEIVAASPIKIPDWLVAQALAIGKIPLAHNRKRLSAAEAWVEAVCRWYRCTHKDYSDAHLVHGRNQRPTFVSILSALTPGPWGRARDGRVVEIKAARRIDFLRSASETLRWLEEKKQEVEKLKMELALKGVVEE